MRGARRLLAMTALLALFVAATYSVASARTLNDILSSGVIRVGVNPTFPPTAMFNAQNQLVGYDIDISEKLASMLGVKVEFVKVTSDSRIPFITSGKIDYVMGGMTRTPERTKLIDFTVPITTETYGAITLASKPFKTIEDLNRPNVTLAEIRGTTPVPLVQQYLPKAKIILLDNHPDVLRAVAQGRADAVVDDIAFLGRLAGTKFANVHWKTLKGHLGQVSYDCLGVNKSDQDLRRWLNVALFNLQQTGFLDATWKKWYGFPMLAPVQAQPYF